MIEFINIFDYDQEFLTDQATTILDLENHKYKANTEDKEITAHYSVTEVINGKELHVTPKMQAAAVVGNQIHAEFANLCSGISVLDNQTNPITKEAYLAVEPWLNCQNYLVEKPLIGSFVIHDKTYYVGGTADLVTLEYDSESDYFTLRVFDLKTSTIDTIQPAWRMQLAVYLEYYTKYFESMGYNIVDKQGYIIRPGHSKPILIVNCLNRTASLNAFASKLRSMQYSHYKIAEEKKDHLNQLCKQINTLANEENQIELLLKDIKQKKALLELKTSTMVQMIYRDAGQITTIGDDECSITPNITMITSADNEYLKSKAPEGFLKTTIKNTLILENNGTRLICEVK